GVPVVVLRNVVVSPSVGRMSRTRTTDALVSARNDCAIFSESIEEGICLDRKANVTTRLDEVSASRFDRAGFMLLALATDFWKETIFKCQRRQMIDDQQF